MCPTATTRLAAVTASMRQMLERGAAVNALNKTLLIDEPQHHCFQKCGWFLELVVLVAARVTRTRAIVIIGKPHCHSSQNCGWFECTTYPNAPSWKAPNAVTKHWWTTTSLFIEPRIVVDLVSLLHGQSVVVDIQQEGPRSRWLCLILPCYLNYSPTTLR